MKLEILVTTDLHGNIFATNYSERNNQTEYGLARISQAIKAFRKNKNTLLLDNGDAIQGTPLLTYAHQHANEVKNPMATAFNLLNYDFINLGNHDFNYGQNILFDYINQTNAPLLTSNVTYNGKPLGNAQIIEVEGKKIALVGLLTQYIPRWERSDHIKNMTFISAYDHLKHELEQLKGKVDFVIAMYHGGMERDLKTHVPTEKLTGENEGFELTTLEGLDILITGHQHRSFVESVNDVLVTQNTYRAQEFVTISLNLETREVDAQIHQVSDYDIDHEFLSHFRNLQEKTQDWLDQEIGYLEDGDLFVEDGLQARIKKHKLVSLLNQVQLDRSKAQLSAISLFNDAQGFKQNITMRDVVSTYLYPNTLVVKKVKGSAIKEMLEFSAEYFTVEDGEIAVNPSYIWPKPQHYNYDMVDGIDYTVRVGNEVGDRIHDLTYQGKPLEMDAYYTMVMNNYRANGGGNYDMIEKSETLEEIQEEMVDTLMQYFKKHPVVKIEHHDNIKVII